MNNAENVPETSSSPATSLGRGFELRIVLFPSAQGNPTEAPPVLPDRESPAKANNPSSPDCAQPGVGENKDPFLFFPSAKTAAKDAVYTIFPGEEFVPFLSELQLEKIEFLPACSLFPLASLGRKSAHT